MGWATLIKNPDGTTRVDYSDWNAFQARMVAEGKLTREHFRFAQDVWNLMEEIKPKLQKAHIKLYGFAFKEGKAESFEITFSDGETVSYEGGYVPAAIDHVAAQEIAGYLPPQLTEEAIRNEVIEGLPKDSKGIPRVDGGMTITRVEHLRNRPLTMDLNMVGAHIDKALRYAHVGPAVDGMTRIIKNKDFQEAMTAVDPDAITGLLIPFIDRAVTQSLYIGSAMAPGLRANASFFKYFRRIAGVKVMAGNVVVALQQFTGLLNSLQHVEARHLKSALWALLARRKDLMDEITERSTFMDDRLRNQMFELTDEMHELVMPRTGPEKLQSKGLRWGYFLAATAQNMVDVIVWKGAFDQAMETTQAGENMFQHEQRAVDEANSAVTLSQGSFSPEDVAGYEKGTPHGRAWTQFTSYFNMVLNQVYFAQKGERVKVALLSFVAPMIVAEAISQTFYDRWDDDDEDGHIDGAVWAEVFLLGPLRGATAMAPGYGSFITNLVDEFIGSRPYGDRVAAAPAMSVLQRSLTGALRAIGRMHAEDKSIRSGDVRDVISLTVLAFPWGGAALAPLIRPAAFATSVALDEKEPEGAWDWARGLTSGR